MTDDLVQRLRGCADEWYEMCDDIHEPLNEAADRIEQLEREKAVVSDLWEQQKEIALNYLADCNKAAEHIEALEAEIEDLRVAAQAQFDRGYYDGCANPIVRYDALRDALADMLHAVCGEKGFAEAVRRDSGRIYPWPALELAEAKSRAALKEHK